MNEVCLVGRLTKDPDLRYTTGENATAICRFSVAVDRRYKREGEQNADFPSVVAWGKTAEFVQKYFCKGKPIGITGRLQTGSYTNKEGIKVYTTEVVADKVEFVGSKADNEATQKSSAISENPDFLNVGEEVDEELPF